MGPFFRQILAKIDRFKGAKAPQGQLRTTLGHG
jgi:hypothetical protein